MEEIDGRVDKCRADREYMGATQGDRAGRASTSRRRSAVAGARLSGLEK